MSSLAWFAGCGIGAGLVASSTMMSALILFSDDLGEASGFDAVRVPVTAVFLAVAVVALIAIAFTVLRRRLSRESITALLLTGMLVTASVAAYYGLFVGGRFTGTSHSRAVIACWLLLVGLGLSALCAHGLLRRRGSWTAVTRIVVVLGVLTPVAWTVAAVAAPEPSAPADTDVTVTAVDVHPVREDAVPVRVSPAPTRVPIAASAIRSLVDPVASTWQVGPGFFTGRLEMINGDTGTVRWRVNVPTGREVSVTVDNRDSLVVVSDPDRPAGPRATAIDAVAGTVRWTSDTPLTNWQYLHDPFSIVGEDVLTAGSEDARVLRAFSPTDGHEIWRFDVGRDCAISKVSSAPLFFAVVTCVGAPDQIRFLDARSGTVTSSREYHGTADIAGRSAAAVADRFSPEMGGRRAATLVALREERTGRIALDLRAPSADGDYDSLSGCDVDGDCLVVATEDDGAHRARLVSLTGRHPDITLPPLTEWPRDVLWLRDQILWTQPAGEDGDHETGVVWVDRATGRTGFVPTPEGSLFAGRGGVTLNTGTELVRFEGVAK